MEHQPQETTNLREITSVDFTFTKRQIGLIMLVVGGLATAGILAIDLIGGGREGGIGPAQSFALAIAIAVTLIGLTLIPLGDKPI